MIRDIVPYFKAGPAPAAPRPGGRTAPAQRAPARLGRNQGNCTLVQGRPAFPLMLAARACPEPSNQQLALICQCSLTVVFRRRVQRGATAQHPATAAARAGSWSTRRATQVRSRAARKRLSGAWLAPCQHERAVPRHGRAPRRASGGHRLAGGEVHAAALAQPGQPIRRQLGRALHMRRQDGRPAAAAARFTMMIPNKGRCARVPRRRAAGRAVTWAGWARPPARRAAGPGASARCPCGSRSGRPSRRASRPRAPRCARGGLTGGPRHAGGGAACQDSARTTARQRQALGAGQAGCMPCGAGARAPCGVGLPPTHSWRAWPGGRARALSAPTRGGPTRPPRPRPRSAPAGIRRAGRRPWPWPAGSRTRRPRAARSGPPRPARAPWRPGPPAAPLRCGPSARCALTLTSTLPSARCTAARPPDAGQLHRAGWQGAPGGQPTRACCLPAGTVGRVALVSERPQGQGSSAIPKRTRQTRCAPLQDVCRARAPHLAPADGVGAQDADNCGDARFK